MSLDKNDIVMVFGNKAQTFATLEDLKEFLSVGGGGSVGDDPDFKALQSTVAGKAEASAVTVLDSKVTQQGGAITAQAQEITALNSTMATKLTIPTNVEPNEGAQILFVEGKWQIINGGEA